MKSEKFRGPFLVLVTWLSSELGCTSDWAALLLLIAFSGRTRRPVSAQIQASASARRRVANVLPRIVGGMVVDRIRDEELVRLVRSDTRPGTLIFNGCVRSIPVADAIAEIAAGGTLGTIDSTGTMRPVSVLFGPVTVKHRQLQQQTLLIPFDEANGASGDAQLNAALGTIDVSDPVERAMRKEAIERLKVLNWDVGFRVRSGNINTAIEFRPSDYARVRQISSLAAVRKLIINEYMGDQTIEPDLGDIKSILDLIEACDLPDDQMGLGTAALRTLADLQSMQHRQITYYDFQRQQACTRSVDAIRMNFKSLENEGLLEQVEKQSRQHAFVLTERGRNFKSRRLANRLRQLFSLESSSETLK